MKRFLLAILVLFVSQTSFAETGPNRNVTNIISTLDSVSISISGTANIYTKEFSTKFVNSANDDVIYYIQASSASGTPNVSYYLQESYQTTTSTTFGTTDTTYLITDVLAESQTTESLIIATAESVNGIWGRIYIKGNTGNPGDTIVTIKMVK